MYQDKSKDVKSPKVYSGYDSGTKSESPAVYIGEAPQHANVGVVNQIMRFGFVGRMANKADKYKIIDKRIFLIRIYLKITLLSKESQPTI